jgi:membrane protein DedA with SNARE-associated domain
VLGKRPGDTLQHTPGVRDGRRTPRILALIATHAQLLHLLHAYGYGFLGVLIALETMGLPLPGEGVLIAASLYAAATHKLDINLVVLWAAMGAILGNIGGYLIGREVGVWLLPRYGRYVGLTEKRVRIGHYLFDRHGGTVVFVGRFIALLRTFAALLAGSVRMNWRSFMLANVTSGILWASLYGYGGYRLGRAVKRVAGPAEMVIVAVAIVVLVLTAIFLKRNEARLEREAEEALAARERERQRRRGRRGERRVDV